MCLLKLHNRVTSKAICGKDKISQECANLRFIINVFDPGKATSLTIYHHLWVNSRITQELLIVCNVANVSRESQVIVKWRRRDVTAMCVHMWLHQ